MRWAFVAKITGELDGAWALVRIGEQREDKTVRAFETHGDAVKASWQMMAGPPPVEMFVREITNPTGATWAVVWAGNERLDDTHVEGYPSHFDALQAIAKRIEQNAADPDALVHGAKLRSLAARERN